MEQIEHVTRQPETRFHQTPILLQHGAWHSAWCWKNWLDYLPSLGYEVHAISLPGHGGSSQAKKRLNAYTMGDYVRTLADAIDSISPTPVVVGHSMGGGILQKYLENHTLPGAVLLAATPSRGTMGMMARQTLQHPVAMLKSMLTSDAYQLVSTPELAQDVLLNPDTSVDMAEFCEHLGSESTLLGIQTLFPFARRNRTPSPVLVIAGDNDNLFTISEAQGTARKHQAEFITFKGQPHNLMLSSAWREVADTVDRWITDRLKLP